MEREMTADVLEGVEVPEAAREFVKRAASAAKERAAHAQVGVEKATAAIERAAASSVVETAKVSRAIQKAVYQEVDAALGGIQKLAAAQSLGDVFQVQSDYFHDRVAATTARAGAIGGYLTELVHQVAKFANGQAAENAQPDAQAI
jgi:phasin protein